MTTDLIAELAEVEKWCIDWIADVAANGSLSGAARKHIQSMSYAYDATLTRIIESEATLSANYEALVIRLHDVTTELEKARKDAALLDFLETDAISITLDGREHDEMTIGTDRGSIEAAMHDSAREG